MTWINARDVKPPDDVMVLVYTPTYAALKIHLATYRSYDGAWYEVKPHGKRHDVTRWCYVPDPTEEQDESNRRTDDR